MAPQVRRALQVSKELLVRPKIRVQRVLLAQRDARGLLDPRDSLEMWGRRGTRALLALPIIRVLPALPA